MTSKALEIMINSNPHQRRPLTKHEKIMGQRMLASVQGAPQFTATIDVQVDALLALKASITPKISLTPLILKCVADVLPGFPVLNAALDENELITFERVNLGVAMDTPFGLRVPVIHGIDALESADIAQQLSELSGKARENRLTLSDMSQGTFTVSNLGMFNVTHFTPIVNLPQTAIMGIGTIRQQVVLDEDGGVSSASMMSVSLSSDHRVADGATAAKFLNAFKSQVEAA